MGKPDAECRYTLAHRPFPDALQTALRSLYVRNAYAGRSHSRAELGDNVADGDGGHRGRKRLVVGLHRDIRARPRPQLVQTVYPGLKRIGERQGLVVHIERPGGRLC